MHHKRKLDKEHLRELNILQDIMELGWDNEFHRLDNFLKERRLDAKKIIELFEKYPNAFRSPNPEEPINQIRTDIIKILNHTEKSGKKEADNIEKHVISDISEVLDVDIMNKHFEDLYNLEGGQRYIARANNRLEPRTKNALFAYIVRINDKDLLKKNIIRDRGYRTEIGNFFLKYFELKTTDVNPLQNLHSPHKLPESTKEFFGQI